MKEIVVVSGKGGTGKTSVTSSLSFCDDSMILADCDVDASNLPILLKTDEIKKEDFYSGMIAKIDRDVCSRCGLCYDKCRFESIIKNDGGFEVDEMNCEGCGYCKNICPSDAVKMNERRIGYWALCSTRNEKEMVYAELEYSSENSGKLVTKVKQEARERAKQKGKNYILVDGPPGIGCPVIASLAMADLVIFVTEASLSGFSDLKRIYELVKKMNIKCGCIINKADINMEISRDIKAYLDENDIALLGELPFDRGFSSALNEGKTAYEAENKYKQIFKKIWEKIK